eukprot:m.10076 g.10076  ORF g.10076 m.10076 type:complete len:245 (+) comp4196_c0_seq2:66-800(+)
MNEFEIATVCLASVTAVLSFGLLTWFITYKKRKRRSNGGEVQVPATALLNTSLSPRYTKDRYNYAGGSQFRSGAGANKSMASLMLSDQDRVADILQMRALCDEKIERKEFPRKRSKPLQTGLNRKGIPRTSDVSNSHKYGNVNYDDEGEEDLLTELDAVPNPSFAGYGIDRDADKVHGPGAVEFAYLDYSKTSQGSDYRSGRRSTVPQEQDFDFSTDESSEFYTDSDALPSDTDTRSITPTTHV